MTYEESYEKCTTLYQLKKEVTSDIATAITINNMDRISVILEKANKVANKKFKENIDIGGLDDV